MSGPAIRTRGLTKRYGEIAAVDRLDLEVRRGEIFGFLGRNGAGKTTTIRMLMGLARASAGTAELLGQPIRPGAHRVFARVGSLVETASAYPNLTVRENLGIHRRLTGVDPGAVDDTIAQLGLAAYADRRAGQLSLGNKQRLSLARALLHRPELLVLDEPANALDPAGIVEVRALLRRLASETGVTVFMSSHILAEVAHLADRIGILHRGRLIAEHDAASLHAATRRWLDIGVSDPERARARLAEALGLTRCEIRGPDALRLFDGVERSGEIARVLVEAGHRLTRLCPDEEDLEAYFMRLTGEDR